MPLIRPIADERVAAARQHRPKLGLGACARIRIGQATHQRSPETEMPASRFIIAHGDQVVYGGPDFRQ